MVHHQPVGLQGGQHYSGFLCVGLPGAAQPGGVGGFVRRFLLSALHCSCNVFNSCLRLLHGGYKDIYHITTLTDDFYQVAWVCSADELALRTLGLECIGQRQTTHDMAAAHLEGCVGAEGDSQSHLEVAEPKNALRTGTPAAA